eukprot:gene16668-5221_t
MALRMMATLTLLVPDPAACDRIWELGDPSTFVLPDNDGWTAPPDGGGGADTTPAEVDTKPAEIRTRITAFKCAIVTTSIRTNELVKVLE